MSKIAKESGVSAGIIYHYFANKDELIIELYKTIKLKRRVAYLKRVKGAVKAKRKSAAK